MRTRTAAAVLIATLGLAGCATGTSATGPAPATRSSATRRAQRRRASPGTARRRPGHHAAPTPRRGPPVSRAANDRVQAQPAPGSCHQIGTGPYSRPDPACTPGAVNPAVTQATIGTTICAAGWTETVRPPESITEREKAASMAAYGDGDRPGVYEYDHLVPLELGGATNDPRNLWPEPGGSPNPKDTVENTLRREVCDGQMTLRAARRTIVTDWVALARRGTAAGRPDGPRPSTSTARASGHCTVTASHSSRHDDFDVHVHSDQPDRTVTVTDAAGRLHSWHTDGAGVADVYFRAPSAAAGETVTVRVGGATCSGSL